MVFSCAKGKAAIDYTLSEAIVWPGEPEKPRIMYLWSLSQVSGQGRSGKFLSMIFGGDDYVSVNPRESDSLGRPHGVFVDDKNKLYIADAGALRVSVIDLDSRESFSIANILGDLAFSSPIGVVAGRDGRIYVSDSNLASVFIFDAGGKYQGMFEGRFKRPTGIAINSEEGTIYVVDTWGHAIYMHGLDGKRLGSIGERGEDPGKLNYPTHIAVDKNGYVYVSDTLNFRVQVYTGRGRFITSFGLIGDSYENFEKIKGIAVDSEGHIYIADSAQDMIKIYNIKGELLLFFGSKGHFYGDLYLPAGIYIDRQDRIFVADAINRRIQAFQFLGGD